MISIIKYGYHLEDPDAIAHSEAIKVKFVFSDTEGKENKCIYTGNQVKQHYLHSFQIGEIVALWQLFM